MSNYHSMIVNKTKEKEILEKYKVVHRMISLPKWLNDEIKKSKINVSAIVQERLIEILKVGKDKESN